MPGHMICNAPYYISGPEAVRATNMFYYLTYEGSAIYKMQ
jgi:hypothetical protein